MTKLKVFQIIPKSYENYKEHPIHTCVGSNWNVIIAMNFKVFSLNLLISHHVMEWNTILPDKNLLAGIVLWGKPEQHVFSHLPRRRQQPGCPSSGLKFVALPRSAEVSKAPVSSAPVSARRWNQNGQFLLRFPAAILEPTSCSNKMEIWLKLLTMADKNSIRKINAFIRALASLVRPEVISAVNSQFCYFCSGQPFGWKFDWSILNGSSTVPNVLNHYSKLEIKE
jgi:hypothetical protein